MRVRFWGTRGSIAAPGPSTLHYGGNTSCVEMVTNAGQRFIFDCGTGARPLGLALMTHGPSPIHATILMGHTHWDHIQGFPFFTPLFVPGNEFTICGPEGGARSLPEVMAGQMEFTYFPVELDQLPAKIQYRDLGEGVHDIDGVRVVTQFMNHPAPALAYRIETDGVVVVYMCDHEPFGSVVWREGAERGHLASLVHQGDRRHAEFMKHADLLIHDAQYTPEEYPAKKNWGHSTFDYVVELAAATDVRQLALTHHEPTHDDTAIASIERRARALALSRNFSLHVFCAYEGLELSVVPPETDRLRTVDVAGPGVPVGAGQLHILVVDDDPNLRMLVAAALGRDGHRITEAVDGEQGLACLERERPDLVLLDLNLPKMNGIAVLAHVRRRPATAELPVILLTAQGDEVSTQVGFAAGATDYLTKPFTVPQLIARVRACWARHLPTVQARAAAKNSG